MLKIKLDRSAIQDLTDRLLTARNSNLKMVLDIDHRLEQLQVEGLDKEVVILNDAKSTTLRATVYSLGCIDTPIVHCLSCKEQARSLAALLPALKGKVKAVFYLGLEDTSLVEELMAEVSLVQRCDSMEELVSEAYAKAEDGDTILYSPASPASEYYGDYATRGEAFKAAVAKLS